LPTAASNAAGMLAMCLQDQTVRGMVALARSAPDSTCRASEMELAPSSPEFNVRAYRPTAIMPGCEISQKRDAHHILTVGYVKLSCHWKYPSGLNSG
jgi:hypothetical protein